MARQEADRPSTEAHRGTGGGAMSTEDVARFLAGEWVAVSSSNLAAVCWDAAAETLQVEYLSGAVWEYSPFSSREAEDFLKATSKGVFVWDHIKRRGTVHEHQKNARQIRRVQVR